MKHSQFFSLKVSIFTCTGLVCTALDKPCTGLVCTALDKPIFAAFAFVFAGWCLYETIKYDSKGE